MHFISLFLKILFFIICVYVYVCVCMSCVYATGPHVCRSQWRPKEGVRYPRAEVTRDHEPTDVGGCWELGSSPEAVHILNHWSVSPPPHLLILRQE